MKYFRREVACLQGESPQEVRDRLRKEGRRAYVDLFGRVIEEVPKCVCHSCTCCHE